MCRSPCFRLLLIPFIFSCLFATQVSANCIGVVTAGGGVDFWAKVGEGAAAAATNVGMDVLVRGPKQETRSGAQKKIIRQMLESGCKALVVAPNSRQIEQELENHAKKGIKIVLIDRDFGGDQFSVVKTDNYKAGYQAGVYMTKALAEGGKVAVFRLDPQVISTSKREQGFVDAIAESGNEVVVDAYLGATRTAASLEAYKRLESRPDLSGVFTPNESTTIAVMAMRKRVSHGTKLVHVGFDTPPSILDGLKAGEIRAVVAQDPYQMGYIGVQRVTSDVKSAIVPEYVDVPVSLVEQEQVQ